MIASLFTFCHLFLGTIIYRPYVYVFFLCFLFFAIRHLGLRGALIYTFVAYAIAFLCEYSSTRNGFPFGMYVYLDGTRLRELWIANIPFWDSLSFVFLSYFSWISACLLLSPRQPSRVSLSSSSAFVGGLLMMLLDVVIDPLTLRGDRWFLGKIYFYPHGGSYFGVTLANFGGWLFVGSVTLLVFQFLTRLKIVNGARWHRLSPGGAFAAFCVYGGVLLFQLSITLWIGEWRLFGASLLVSLMALVPFVLAMRGANA